MIQQEVLRPNTWNDLEGLDQQYVEGLTEKEVLIKLFEEDKAQCVIFHGPSGTGKTSAALLCAKTYLGENTRLCIRTNASDERGINMVRRIRDEADRRVGKHRLVYILDEYDGALKPTQKAFNAIIEENSHLAVFILIVNDLTRVIPAIISRSTIFHFPPLPRNTTLDWIKKTAKKLNVLLFAGVAEKLVDYYGGDLRRIVNDFFTKYEGQEVKDWNPPPTYAELIFNAKNPFNKWIEIRKEKYIEPLRLLRDIFKLSGYKNPQQFAVASNNIANNGTLAELINMKLALGSVKK